MGCVIKGLIREAMFQQVYAKPVCRGLHFALVMIFFVPFHVYGQNEPNETSVEMLNVRAFWDTATGGPIAGWQIGGGESFPDNVPIANLTGLLVQPGSNGALCVSGKGRCIFISPRIRFDKGLQSISGAVTALGNGEAQVKLVWLIQEKEQSHVSFKAVSSLAAERTRFNLSEVVKPEKADSLQILMIVDLQECHSFCWQTLTLIGVVHHVPEMNVYYNMLGYEATAPKAFTVWATFKAQNALFRLKDEFNENVLEKPLGPAERISGTCGTAWDGFFYRGDFSEYEKEGTYSIEVVLDDSSASSRPFAISFDLFMPKLLPILMSPFVTQRVSTPPTSQKDLQLWEDTGINAVADALILWELTRSWSILKARYESTSVLQPLEEEVRFGIGCLEEWLNASMEIPPMEESDFFYYLNTLSCFAQASPDALQTLDIARKLIQPYKEQHHHNPWLFFAAMDLYRATGETDYLNYARTIFPGVVLARAEPLLDFESEADVPLTVELIQSFVNSAKPLLQYAQNPFGLVKSSAFSGKGFFCWTDSAAHPLLGNNARILKEAELAAQAYRYTSQKEYLSFVYDQINWILGNNPFGVCLIGGLDTYPPDVGLPACKGYVLYGIGPQSKKVDVPSSPKDENVYTAGCSLHNNVRLISALAYLKRIPMAKPKP